MSTNSHLHLAVALNGAGWHPAAWREPDARAEELLSPGRWLELVQIAERGLLEMVTIEDSHELHQNLPAAVVDPRSDTVRGRLDAIMIAARLAPVTQRIGIVAAATTTISEPFLLSTQIATLDFISHGRAGWLAQVSDLPGDGGYVGPRAIASGDETWAEAAEYVEIVRRLWDSWDDEAEIRDAQSHRFFDRERVHHINFEGAQLSVKGPSITPRPPQGQPIVATSVGPSDSAAELALAAAATDVIFLQAPEEAALAPARALLEAAVIGVNRTRADVRVFADIAVLVDSDAETATARRQRLDAAADRSAGASESGLLTFVGSSATLAEQLIAWQDEHGLDGFRLWPAALPHDLAVVAQQLTEELRRRGRFCSGDDGSATLRARLGLERPVSRFKDAAFTDRDALPGGGR